MKKLLLMMLVAGCAAVQAQTRIDFAEPGSWPFSAGAFTDPAEAAKQVVTEKDGLRVFSDAAKEKPGTLWGTMVVPQRTGGGNWLGRRIRLVCRLPQPSRITKDIALNFTDKDGETFQFHPSGVKTAADGNLLLAFSVTDGGYTGRPWGGGDRKNGKLDPPVYLSAVNFHFNTGIPAGDAKLFRIEEADARRDDVRRETVSREPALLFRPGRDRYSYTVSGNRTTVRHRSYPGPKPFQGAEEILLRTYPVTAGEAELVLKEEESGGLLRFQAKTAAETRFRTELPVDRRYQFHALGFTPAAGEPVRAFEMTALDGVFRQSAAEAFRLDVDTVNPLHIATNEKERPVLTISNPSGAPLHGSVTLHVRDCFGRGFDIPFDRTVAGGETVRIPLPWPMPAKGLWRVGGTVKAADGSTAEAETRFAVLDPHPVTPILPKPKFRMGIHYHGTRYSPVDIALTLDALTAVGAKFTRTDYGFMFGDVQPEGPDKYDWKPADDLLEGIRAHGLALEAIIYSTPVWATDPERRRKLAGERRLGSLSPYPGLFGKFCEKIAARYDTKIDYWEIGNEWDLVPAEVLPIPDALRLQREAYEGIKKVCPEACVIPNGWAYAVSADRPAIPNPGLIETFAEHPELYDAMPQHLHGPFEYYERSLQKSFFPLRERHGLAKKPWLSGETALTSVFGEEDAVARTVWKKILYAWAWGAADYIWYNLKATGWKASDSEQAYGLITADYYPRAGYAAFSALTEIFEGLNFDARLHSGDGRHVFRFKGEKGGFRGVVIAGWDSSGKPRSPIRFRTDSKRARLADFMNNRTEVPLAEGETVFTPGPDPSALVLDGATFADVHNLPLCRERGSTSRDSH